VDATVPTIGVLDKAVAIVDALARAGRPLGLAELMAASALPRATAYRIAVALEGHGLVRRDADGRFAPGLRLVGLGRSAAMAFPLADAARPTLERLRDETGESVQLFVRSGAGRLCIESFESSHGLRWIVPVGSMLPLDRGSAGRVLSGVGGAVVESVEEREVGVASVSAGIHDQGGAVVAAVCVSGPVERLTRAPARRYGAAVVAAAEAIETAISDSGRGAHTPAAWTT
jgi:DNA-binding IclR family transcriptional regulator